MSEAYAVLSDPQKRALYDQYGHQGIDQRYAREDVYRGTDFSSAFEGMGDLGLGGSFFENLFGGMGFDVFGAGGRQRRAGTGQGAASGGGRGRDLEIEATVTLDEAFRGTDTTVTVPRYDACPACGGSGAKPGTSPSSCPDCRGSGQRVVSSGIFQMAQPCPGPGHGFGDRDAVRELPRRGQGEGDAHALGQGATGGRHGLAPPHEGRGRDRTQRHRRPLRHRRGAAGPGFEPRGDDLLSPRSG